MIEKIAQAPGMLDAIRAAHATARAYVWDRREQPPGLLVVDVDATLVDLAFGEGEGGRELQGRLRVPPAARLLR